MGEAPVTPYGKEPPQDYLNTEQVSRWLETPISTIRKWVGAGTLPAVKMPNGKLKFRKVDVKKHILQES